MNQINEKTKTFRIEYPNGYTEIGAMPKLTRNGRVLYVTSRSHAMIGIGSGVFADLQKRFKQIREQFKTEEEFLQVLGVNKEEMGRY